MKLSTRGFTLVELMIVIAIIGILAAALFPSLTSYLARGRDTSRTAHLKDISVAVGAFMIDNQTYPTISTNCIDSASFGTKVAQYLPKFPEDPTKSTGNCGTAGRYGYGTGTVSGSSSFALSALMENPNGGNTGSTLSSFQGNGSITVTGASPIDSFTKGQGAGFVQRY